MRTPFKTLTLVTLAALTLGAARADDDNRGYVRGYDMMSPEEHQAHFQAMQSMTPQQRYEYRLQMHQQMQQRAEQQGYRLYPHPMQPLESDQTAALPPCAGADGQAATPAATPPCLPQQAQPAPTGKP